MADVTPPPGQVVTERRPDAAWDRFVAAATPAPTSRLSAWAAVKAVNGWSAHRVLVRLAADATARGRRRSAAPGPRPAPAADALGVRLRAARAGRRRRGRRSRSGPSRRPSASGLPADAGRVSHLRIDPEIEAGRAARSRRRAAVAPCRPPAGARRRRSSPTRRGSSTCVPTRTRCGATCARSGGSTSTRHATGGVTRRRRAAPSGCPSSTGSTARRPTGPGFLIRAESAYRDVWEAFAPSGHARLLFAQAADGEPQATLLLVRCGPRVVEPYGGMTAAGAESRANYLLKWEAIRSSREAGRHELRPVGPRDRRDRPLQDRLRRPRGPLHRGLGPGPRARSGGSAYELAPSAAGSRLARRRGGIAATGSAAAYGGRRLTTAMPV